MFVVRNEAGQIAAAFLDEQFFWAGVAADRQSPVAGVSCGATQN